MGMPRLSRPRRPVRKQGIRSRKHSEDSADVGGWVLRGFPRRSCQSRHARPGLVPFSAFWKKSEPKPESRAQKRWDYSYIIVIRPSSDHALRIPPERQGPGKVRAARAIARGPGAADPA